MKKTHDDRYLPKNPRYRKMLENDSESRSLYSDAWKRLKKDKAAMIGLCMIALFILLAIVHRPIIAALSFFKRFQASE